MNSDHKLKTRSAWLQICNIYSPDTVPPIHVVSSCSHR